MGQKRPKELKKLLVALRPAGSLHSTSREGGAAQATTPSGARKGKGAGYTFFPEQQWLDNLYLNIANPSGDVDVHNILH